jgi:hypothetical protein
VNLQQYMYVGMQMFVITFNRDQSIDFEQDIIGKFGSDFTPLISSQVRAIV